MNHEQQPPDRAPHEAQKSRRWRVAVGIASLIYALVAGFYATTNTVAVVRATNAIDAAGGHVPAGAMALAVTIIVIFCLVALAGLGVGIWNLAARATASAGPLIAAIAFASALTVLVAVFILRSPSATNPVQVVAVAVNVLLVVRTVAMLRRERVPAGATADPV